MSFIFIPRYKSKYVLCMLCKFINRYDRGSAVAVKCAISLLGVYNMRI